MPLRPLEQLLCPLDQYPLHRDGKTWRCSKNHCFDIAKQGYVNLLPVQNKKSLDPGDSQLMIQARRLFLDSGAYDPLASALADLVGDLSSQDQALAILDAGCGEGYYLNAVCTSLLNSKPELTLTATGLDISKWAVRATRSRNSGINGLVASNRQIPLPNNSQDILLCTFGFPVFSEFQRVLKPGGHIVMVDPGPEHLIELRQQIYEEIRRSPPASLAAGINDDWQISSETTLSFSTPILSAELFEQLLIMTPHLYRASKAGRERAAKLEQLALSADVCIRVISHQG
jgi:23S rRNA (guanine745-N1)-methyltransferase